MVRTILYCCVVELVSHDVFTRHILSFLWIILNYFCNIDAYNYYRFGLSENPILNWNYTFRDIFPKHLNTKDDGKYNFVSHGNGST